MPRQRHQARYERPITEVFAALVQQVAARRWAAVATGDSDVPRVGFSYARERGSLRVRGRVLELIRPVSLSLEEMLLDPPCHVRLKLRWRLEPLDGQCLAQLEARYELNGAAYLNRRHWRGRLYAHCGRSLSDLGAALERAEAAQGASGSSGHSHGNSSMTAMKRMTVNGKPTLR